MACIVNFNADIREDFKILGKYCKMQHVNIPFKGIIPTSKESIALQISTKDLFISVATESKKLKSLLSVASGKEIHTN